jgi:pSer/pThr/pTyr-binding forkhead associated (FHA) protein
VLSPTSPPASELELLVNADRDYYKAQIERGDIIEAEFPYPKYPHERRFTFAQSPIRIGRASASRGIAPEIDLTGPPLDPAVSHLHAQLLRHQEGWVVVDLGSANGTRLNDSEEPLEAETEIPVHRGDRIHLGVWTTITIQ